MNTYLDGSRDGERLSSELVFRWQYCIVRLWRVVPID